jgi:hypothetical protein
MEREQKRLAHGAGSASRQKASKPSPSRDLLEDSRLAALEESDNFAGMRNVISHIARAREQWAGIPMPLEGQPLVIEKSFPNAQELCAIGQAKEAVDDSYAGATIINRFYSTKKGRDVVIFEHEGKRDWGTQTAVHGLTHAMLTLGASFAWGIEQEARAVQLLGSMLRHHQLKQYLLTGSFLEKSQRSGVMYMFRRLRPTVAIRFEGDKSRILAALCLHPIGYYESSWAGAMCPTDDVVAHLSLMRGDEVMFWRRSNQQAPWRKEAGL